MHWASWSRRKTIENGLRLRSGHIQRKDCFKFRVSGKSADFPETHFHQRGRKLKQHLQRLFPVETAALRVKLPVFLCSLSCENAFGALRRARQTRNINNSSAIYGQSATTTTAASGGNREELLGQRPARRECRPRHDADAGCRNPIAEAIQNRPAGRKVIFFPKNA